MKRIIYKEMNYIFFFLERGLVGCYVFFRIFDLKGERREWLQKFGYSFVGIKFGE